MIQRERVEFARITCHGHEDLPGLKDGRHPSIVARQRNVRKLSLTVQAGLFFPGILSAD